MEPAKPCNGVRFGPFRLDLAAGELHKGERKIRLQEQPFRVLQLLVERPGEVVTREDLQKRLWPNDTIVEFDHSINSAMRRLRDALGDTAEKPKYVETVARRGYRLLVAVEWVAAAPGAQPGSADLSLKSAAFAPGKAAELETNSALPSGSTYRKDDLLPTFAAIGSRSPVRPVGASLAPRHTADGLLHTTPSMLLAVYHTARL